MKEQKKSKIGLKKLTIARINLGSMRTIKGGSSVAGSDPKIGYCIVEP